MDPIKAKLEYSHTDEITFDADIIPTINKCFAELSDYSIIKQETSESSTER
ncbi:phage head-tail connector protein [Pseudomonas sp. FW305-60]|uniref:phage head-tail connector protein n=1 Tax=Pseudomonas sp. FW305-60 TaxID=2751341 RepID=UPI003FA7ED62